LAPKLTKIRQVIHLI